MTNSRWWKNSYSSMF